MLRAAGLTDMEMGPLVDVFAGAPGEDKARQFETYGVALRAWKAGAGASRVDG